MRRLVAVLLLALLLVPVFEVLPVNSASSDASLAWWNSSYAFRREVSFTNPTNQPLVNQPIVLHLTFGPSEVYDAVSDLRLVNATTTGQTEVTSFVLSQEHAGGYVSSATLLFYATMKPASTSSLELYYGNPLARAPSYRPAQPVSSITNGLLSADGSVPRPGSSGFVLTFGNTYSETFLSKMFVGAAHQGYGSVEVSQTPYGNNSGWSFAANDPSASLRIMTDQVNAGGIDLVTSVILYVDHAVILNLVSGSGTQGGPASSLVEIVDSSGLSALGQVASNYDSKSAAFSSSVAGAYVGFIPAIVPSGFDVGNSTSVINDARTGTFHSRTAAYGDANGAFSWNLQAPPAGGVEVLTFGWSVGTTLQHAEASLGNTQVLLAQAGREDIRGTFLPNAATVWTASVAFTNAVVGPRGIQVPLTVYGATWLPGTIQVEGTLFYQVPGPGFAQSNAGWTASDGNTGDSNVGASTTFYSLDRGANVARLSISNYALNSTGYAGLTSQAFAVSGFPSPTLEINYEASLDTTQGLPSDQIAYVALDISGGFAEVIQKTVYFPVAGSSVTESPLACGNARATPPFPGKTTTVIQAGNLIADGTWRRLSVGLGAWNDAPQFVAKIRFCVATTRTFVGTDQILLSSASVTAQGDARSLLEGSMSYQTPLLNVGFNPASGSFLSSVTFNGTAAFSIESNSATSSINGSAFKGAISAPVIEVNSTRGGVPNASVPIKPLSLIVQSPFSGLGRDLIVGKTVVATIQGGGVIYSNQLTLPVLLGNGSISYPVSLSLRSIHLSAQVNDADGKPVPGAKVEFIPQTTNSPALTKVTNASGTTNVDLLQWNYQVPVMFDGVQVWSALEVVNGSGTLTLTSNVFETGVRVTDAAQSPVQGAQVYITLGNSSKTGFTDQAGVYTFQAAGNQVYHVLISRGSTQIYNGSLKATPNNSQVQIPTTYTSYSPTLEVAAVVGVMVILIFATVYMGLRRRTKR